MDPGTHARRRAPSGTPAISLRLPSGCYVIPDAVTDRVPIGDDEAILGKRFLQRYPMLAFDDTLGGSARFATDGSRDEIDLHCRGPVELLLLLPRPAGPSP